MAFAEIINTIVPDVKIGPIINLYNPKNQENSYLLKFFESLAQDYIIINAIFKDENNYIEIKDLSPLAEIISEKPNIRLIEANLSNKDQSGTILIKSLDSYNVKIEEKINQNIVKYLVQFEQSSFSISSHAQDSNFNFNLDFDEWNVFFQYEESQIKIKGQMLQNDFSITFSDKNHLFNIILKDSKSYISFIPELIQNSESLDENELISFLKDQIGTILCIKEFLDNQKIFHADFVFNYFMDEEFNNPSNLPEINLRVILPNVNFNDLITLESNFYNYIDTYKKDECKVGVTFYS